MSRNRAAARRCCVGGQILDRARPGTIAGLSSPAMSMHVLYGRGTRLRTVRFEHDLKSYGKYSVAAGASENHIRHRMVNRAGQAAEQDRRLQPRCGISMASNWAGKRLMMMMCF